MYKQSGSLKSYRRSYEYLESILVVPTFCIHLPVFQPTFHRAISQSACMLLINRQSRGNPIPDRRTTNICAGICERSRVVALEWKNKTIRIAETQKPKLCRHILHQTTVKATKKGYGYTYTKRKILSNEIEKFPRSTNWKIFSFQNRKKKTDSWKIKFHSSSERHRKASIFGEPF